MNFKLNIYSKFIPHKIKISRVHTAVLYEVNISLIRITRKYCRPVLFDVLSKYCIIFLFQMPLVGCNNY